MAFVVEDGSCVLTANSFATLLEADTYFEDFGGDWAGTDAAKESALVRASSWLSTFPEWDGRRTCGRSQGLAWPRIGVEDCDGNTIPSDAVPVEVKAATFAAALVELGSPGSLTPTITPGGQVKRVKVDVIEQEFMTPQEQGFTSGKDPLESLRPMVAKVQDYLKCLASFPNDTEDTPHPWVA